ncbi:MAG: tripartite tricarboxylate transporter substrate binding protein [Spirochaetaceae bacterium]|nr:MAG: tripartite tricarboxylate transporter substrate binding protein [Spirochaetaceae bacterium]
MKKLIVMITLLAGVAVAMTFARGTPEEDPDVWRPTRPITVVVPWGAGGSTDQTVRPLAAVLEEELGQSVVVVNTPGATGSVGTAEVLNARRDGYTWVSGAVKDLATYRVRDLLETDLDDWVLFLSLAQVNVVSVNANEPYQDFGELAQAFLDRPGEIDVGTAGVGSAGHTAIQLINRYRRIEYTEVTYGGGAPAVTATVAGEVPVTTQLASEQVDMIRAGKLRPLAVLSDAPLRLEGVDEEIPPITNWIPEFEAAPIYFGIFVPADVPQNVIKTLGRIWDESIVGNQRLERLGRESASVFAPKWGDEARAAAFPMVQLDAWLAYEMGDTVMRPDEAGIPRP